tara:strand:- start:2452 stop:3192 length:741 start_codon:yes stop_codon:yes gene_type:complete
MENWIITDCGKIIDIAGEKGLSWRHIVKNYKVNRRISKFNIDESKFNKKIPTHSDVENAIFEQLPTLIFESGYEAEWYVLDNIEYSSSSIKIKKEEIKLNIPNNIWNRLNYENSKINVVNYMALLDELNYFNKSSQKVTSLTNDLYLVAFYDIWCVFYRIKKIKGNVKIDYCIMRNNYSYCRDIVAMTYAKNIIKKDYIFSSINGKNSLSIMFGNLNLRYGWLEARNLKRINKNKLKEKVDYIKIV